MHGSARWPDLSCRRIVRGVGRSWTGMPARTKHGPALMRKILSSTLAGMVLLALAATSARAAPYPASTAITGVTWDQSSYRYGGIGGDLWPVASAAGGTVYTAWGDGVVGCRTKVSYGVATIAGGPSADLRVIHCGPAGSGNGKIGSLLAVGSTLYGGFDPQHPAWPNSTLSIVRSTDGGRTWKRPSWNSGSRELLP